MDKKPDSIRGKKQTSRRHFDTATLRWGMSGLNPDAINERQLPAAKWALLEMDEEKRRFVKRRRERRPDSFRDNGRNSIAAINPGQSLWMDGECGCLEKGVNVREMCEE